MFRIHGSFSFVMVLSNKISIGIGLAAGKFIHLEVAFISIFFNSFINCFTFFKYATMIGLANVEFLLTWLTINVELLKTEITYALNFLANSSPAIKAPYFTLLFEALNPKQREFLVHSLFGLFNRMLVLIHFHLMIYQHVISTFRLEFILKAPVVQILRTRLWSQPNLWLHWCSWHIYDAVTF